MDHLYPYRRKGLRAHDVMVGPAGRLAPSLSHGLLPFFLIGYLSWIACSLLLQNCDPMIFMLFGGAISLVYLTLLSRSYGFSRALFALRPFTWPKIGLGLATGLASLGAGIVLAPEYGAAPGWDITPRTELPWAAYLAMLVFATVIFLPFLEETIYRGWLQPAMIDTGISPTVTILILAVAFGFFHTGDFAGAFVSGLMFGVVRHATGTLLAPLIAHAVHNSGVVLLDVLAVTLL